MVEELCCKRCKNAKPASPCVCRCGGRFHGINRAGYSPDNLSRTINANLGGEVADVITKLEGHEFNCWCNHKFIVFHFMGYKHEGGLADADGVKWWVYIQCPYCNFVWSWNKLENRLKNQKLLNQLVLF